MPRLKCPCGHLIDMSELPSKHEFLVIASPGVESVVNDLVTAHEDVASKKRFELSAYAAIVLRSPRLPVFIECPECRRLLLYESSAVDGPPLIVYKPDDVGIGGKRTLGSVFNREAKASKEIPS